MVNSGGHNCETFHRRIAPHTALLTQLEARGTDCELTLYDSVPSDGCQMHSYFVSERTIITPVGAYLNSNFRRHFRHFGRFRLQVGRHRYYLIATGLKWFRKKNTAFKMENELELPTEWPTICAFHGARAPINSVSASICFWRLRMLSGIVVTLGGVCTVG